MNALNLFVPCAAGVEAYLAAEVAQITGLPATAMQTLRGGVQLQASWRDALLLNLHSRLGMRVLIQLAQAPYLNEQDIYNAASAVAWEMWFTPRESFRIDFTAQHSPLKSLNFAALRVKDAIADRFREKTGVRPDVDTQRPAVRVHLHLSEKTQSIYLDTSGEPLFKRGWREDKGDAPLKETLAAAMLAASAWSMPPVYAPGETRPAVIPLAGVEQGLALYDPCCGSGTIAIEAAQIACRMAAGAHRRFGFERLPMCGSNSKNKRKRKNARRAPKCLPAMSRFAWLISPNAMPSAPVWRMPLSYAAATHCNACRPAICLVSCWSTRRMASASRPPVWRVHPDAGFARQRRLMMNMRQTVAPRQAANPGM